MLCPVLFTADCKPVTKLSRQVVRLMNDTCHESLSRGNKPLPGVEDLSAPMVTSKTKTRAALAALHPELYFTLEVQLRRLCWKKSKEGCVRPLRGNEKRKKQVGIASCNSQAIKNSFSSWVFLFLLVTCALKAFSDSIPFLFPLHSLLHVIAYKMEAF